MNLGTKLFNISTPYKRVFINFQIEEKVITLPARNTAMFIVGKGDFIFFDEVEQLEKSLFLDQEVIQDKTNNFLENFQELKSFIKNTIFNSKKVEFEILNKVIVSEYLAINCIYIK